MATPSNAGDPLASPSGDPRPGTPTPSPSGDAAHFPSDRLSGLVLILAAACALMLANSPWSAWYFQALSWPVGPELTAKLGPMTPLLWINDALMAVFFLYVGLEVKREWLTGALAERAARRLPVAAAVAGMAVPSLIFLAVTGGDKALARGWAIPAATDIAFAVGVLAFLGKRVPPSLKLLLVTIAIIDDIGAILIIAIGYTAAISGPALLAAAAILGALYFCNRQGITALPLYLGGFALLWFVILLSGVHATIAGVLAALTVPLRSRRGSQPGSQVPLIRLEHGLHPWVSLLIVPLFGLANAGVSFGGGSGGGGALSTLSLAIVCGLVIGKPLGIWGGMRALCALGWTRPPKGANWVQIAGVAQLCGIGFTMSLFIGGLAFSDAALVVSVKVGVLLASLLSAVLGAVVLWRCPAPRD